MQHVISVLVENHFGVLAHVSGLFSSRGFNIDSLAVGETDDPTISRMTIVAKGDDRILDQIMKQLDKLVDVVKVIDLTKDEMISRELALCKVSAPAPVRSDVIQVVNTFRGKIVDVNPKTITVEITGTESKIDAMLELLRPFGIREVVRTGLVAMSRVSDGYKVPPPPAGVYPESNIENLESNGKKKTKKKKLAKSKK
ncbi:MAG: acetolactate synthase small subunit [Candidatus Omnitrophica bacterium]|nr:acetolactate synthase small subunit [Candidatus Omnitrophota bacterium]